MCASMRKLYHKIENLGILSAKGLASRQYEGGMYVKLGKTEVV